jgi:hypothetical protein
MATIFNWYNKNGTGERKCKCGTWQQHWMNFSSKTWPYYCSVESCNNRATLGAHVANSSVDGEQIVPMCNSCNGYSGKFNLKDGVTLVKADTSSTCR